MNAPAIFRRTARVGQIVTLADGRVGTVDTISPSPMANEAGASRAYVIGLNGEFAAWELLNTLTAVKSSFFA